MTEEEQQAQSLKYSSEYKVWLMMLPSTSRFAMFDWAGQLMWIGDAEDIPAAYASRPTYTPKAPETRQQKTAELAASLGLTL